MFRDLGSLGFRIESLGFRNFGLGMFRGLGFAVSDSASKGSFNG